MESLLSRAQISLNLTCLLISHVEELYPNAEDGSDRFLSVMRDYEADLVRSIGQMAATFPELMQMKAAIKEAGEILSDIMENEADRMRGWYAGCRPSNPAHCMANILVSTIQEMSWSVLHNEELYPELKSPLTA